MASDLLAGLNAAQLEAVTSDAAPLCILAGAGSGKTRVLTRRIAHRVATGTALSEHVLALTFTRRAAAELSSRLAQLGLRDRTAAGTFHAVAYAQLRRRWADLDQRPPDLLDRKLGLLIPLLPLRRDAAVQPADVASEIEWAKARMVDPSAYAGAATAAGRRPPLPLAVMASVYSGYESEKQRRNLVDFDDLLRLAAVAVETDPTFAASQRWRFRHIFVDEFQDVNPLQCRLLKAWLGQSRDLCVVGDPNQAIYEWNGADADNLIEFSQRFPGGTEIHLDDNYRSSPQVLAVANSIIDSQGGVGVRHLRANRPDGAVPSVRSFPTEHDEAAAIAGALRRRAGGTGRWSEMAVLTRTHAQLLVLEEALRNAAVPYRLRGALPFLNRPEVAETLAELTRKADRALSMVVSDLPDPSLPAPVEEDVAADPAAGDDGRRAALGELRRLAHEHLAADPAASVGAFVAWLRATMGRENEPSHGDAVELATFHAAKGLEWRVVFLAGLEQGLVPISHADTPRARAEERRLLYVAVTRARDELACSWSQRRTFGSRSMSRSVSPYLKPVEAAIADLREGGSGADWRRFVEDGRTLVDNSRSARNPGWRPGHNADPVVLQALKTWRATAAKASGVPAFVVLHDATLAAMADARPSSRADLLALPGVGPVKVERYGEALLAVVAQAGDSGVGLAKSAG